MVGEDMSLFVQIASLNGARVAVAAERAEATEDALASLGLCNWLVDYGDSHRVYCAQPASSGVLSSGSVLCSEHRGTFGVPIGEGLV